MMHLGDIIAFLGTCSDRLTPVVEMEPSFQVRGDLLRAIVKQDGVLELLAGVRPLQSKVQRVRTVAQLSVLAHLKPRFRACSSTQRSVEVSP